MSSRAKPRDPNRPSHNHPRHPHLPSSCRGNNVTPYPIRGRYPRWTGCAATPPTCRPLPTSGILPNRLPRPPYPVFPDPDRGPRGARLPPTTCYTTTHPSPVVTSIVAPHLMRGRYPRWTGGAATPTNLPPITHIRHSPKPSSPTSVPRLPRLRSGTQGGAATPNNLLHNHTPFSRRDFHRRPALDAGPVPTVGHGRRSYRHQPAAHYPHPAFSQPVFPDLSTPSSPTPIGDPGGRGYLHQPATQPHTPLPS